MATHARFDEGMNDLPIDQIPPNVQLLQRSEYGKRLPAETEESSIDEFHLFNSPYSNVVGKKLRDQCNEVNYGLSIARDQVNNRAFVHDMKGGSSARKMFSTDRAASSVKGAFIISVNGKPTFTVEDVLVALRTAKSNKVRTLDIEFALEKRLSARDQRKVTQEHNQFTPETMRDHFVNVVDVGDYDDIHNIPSITISDLRDIASIRYPDLDFSEESIPTEIIEVAINAIRSDATTPEEQSIGHFTRRKLKRLNTWEQWQAGERKQLDQFDRQDLYGEPVYKPPGAILLRPHWQYSIKRDGTRRSRNCCDGSKRAAHILHCNNKLYQVIGSSSFSFIFSFSQN